MPGQITTRTRMELRAHPQHKHENRHGLPLPSLPSEERPPHNLIQRLRARPLDASPPRVSRLGAIASLSLHLSLSLAPRQKRLLQLRVLHTRRHRVPTAGAPSTRAAAARRGPPACMLRAPAAGALASSPPAGAVSCCLLRCLALHPLSSPLVPCQHALHGAPS